MFLKLKLSVDKGNRTGIDHLDVGQLYVDTDGDVNLVVDGNDSDKDDLRAVCFTGADIVIMEDPPEVERLISFDDVEIVDE